LSLSTFILTATTFTYSLHLDGAKIHRHRENFKGESNE